MQFAWFNQKYETGSSSLLLLNNGVQAPDSSTHFSHTAGLISKNQLGGVNLTTEFYYQFGKDGNGNDLSAYLASINLGFKLGKNGLDLGADYLTGTDAGSSKNNSFTPLYGTNHKFYGLMDYFFVGNSNANSGLIDIYAKLKLKTGNRSALLIHAHEFLAEAELKAVDGSDASAMLGTEVDLVYNFNIDKNVNLKIGYSQLLAASSMELIKSGDKDEMNYWAWTMLTIKPTLFEK
ncbi:MAG: alginate export family protein [Cyclobacteriaceae bacterium]|nr:alginate export family protein [Cyclobacteriaceae bacterium HetDA_MAG_MS6]